MAAMFWNVRFMLIFEDRSFMRCAIWLCMYWMNVIDIHLPCFLIMVSETPWSLSAIAPPARKECTPMRSGSSPFSFSLRVRTAVRMPVLMSFGVMGFHSCSCVNTSQRRESPVPPLVRM